MPHSQFRGRGTGAWTPRDRAKALAYRAYARTVCPQCGTRADEWDPALGGDEDAYVASSHKCIGCELIADKQDQLGDVHGAKVALLPFEIHAALQVQEAMKAKDRRPRPWDSGAEAEDD